MRAMAHAGLAAGAVFLLVLVGTVDARAADCMAYGYLVSVQGEVTIRNPRGGDFRAVALNTVVCVGDIIRVGTKSRAGIYFADIETVGYVDQDTTAVATARPADRSAILDLFEGAINFLTREPRSLEIRTPFVNAGVKGTEFEVRVVLDRPLADRAVGPISGHTVVNLIEGTLTATSGRSTTEIVTNQSVRADGTCPAGLSLTQPLGQSQCEVQGGVQPLRVEVRQPNSVDWALYYPQISSAAGVPKELAAAGSLLAVGRVAEALPLICPQPQSGDQMALQAIVELTRNDPLGLRRSQDACGNALPAALQADNRRLALELATRATTLSPKSAAPQIALSYAWQAAGELEEAQKAVERAVALAPGEALARARLAEIWLSLGYRDKAVKEADRAKKLAPNLSRTQSVYGFAALAAIDMARARFAFTTAIQLNPADPLPRLGLGLAKIREGNIADGRHEIEIAAGLDPQNSLIRSYLGKAYFEEKRGKLDATQFDLAKKLDPSDPTPWLYDAIRLETENRPVEALHNIQKSIELNDNRAVYRSRLELDEDAAVRTTSLGRIYQDLGFDQLALVEGTKSLSYDPANYSAHRFLSDSYAALPRHEIARASELLQSQLLQPINADPVQPQLAETDLNILTGTGPAEVGFNEFTPLFQHDGLRFNASGIVGNESTYSDESVFSGIAGRAAFSLGQFHYQTDGFRPNNDVQHDIYDAFGQIALTDDLDVQVEYRHRDTEEGDRHLNFDPENFSPTDRREITESMPRFGLHYRPAPGNDLIASLIYSDRTEDLKQDLGGGDTFFDTLQTKGYDAQAEYLFRSDPVNLAVGAGTSDLSATELQRTVGPTCPIGSCDFATDSPIHQYNAYAYLNATLPKNVNWTVGLSFDSFEEAGFSQNEVNPKAGVAWDITDKLRLRAAYIETVKRALTAEQTLEPTQVAGFNQFFDDVNGTKIRRYGIGLDWQVTDDLSAGIEASRRDLDVPVDFGAGTFLESQDDDVYRAYAYWSFADNWAATAEFAFEDFGRGDFVATMAAVPDEIHTFTVPVAIEYFGSSGILDGVFGRLGVTFVHQVLDFPSSVGSSRDSSFALVDAAIGYRLPDRYGIISLEAWNLFDEKFKYQDISFQTPRTPNPRFVPDRTIMARITMSF